MDRKYILISIPLLAISFFGIFAICSGWFESTTMPGAYTAPINTGAVNQGKSGNISAQFFYDYDNSTYYINPSGNSVISGKITTSTSTIATDDAKTLVTKDYVGDACRLVAYNGSCPTGYSTSTGVSRGAGYIICCRVGS